MGCDLCIDIVKSLGWLISAFSLDFEVPFMAILVK